MADLPEALSTGHPEKSVMGAPLGFNSALILLLVFLLWIS